MSKAGVWLLQKLNRLLPKPVHPFNLQNDGKKSYAEWQYERGGETIRFYLDFATPEQMFAGKRLLDIGCGAGGKSLYYAGLGAQVTGIDILPAYEAEARALCEKLGYAYGTQFRFQTADAADLPFADGSFDTIILNDAVEHVAQPEAMLAEALRVLRPGGRLYANFPPYHHPFGAHLSDAIGIPWVHLFFSESTLITAYKQLVRDLPDGAERIAFRISRRPDGSEYFSYINHMTIRRFRRILQQMQIRPSYYREVPLRPYFAPLCHLPLIKEMFVKMVVFVVEKEAQPAAPRG